MPKHSSFPDLIHATRHSLLVAANGFALAEDSADADLISSVRRDGVHALNLVGEMCQVYGSSSNLRQALATDLTLHAAEAETLVNTLNDKGLALKKGVSSLTQAKEATTEALQKAFQAYQESPECRIDLMADSPAANLPVSSDFYPFMAYLRSSGSPMFRAEALATIALYVDSGWAEKDLTADLGEFKSTDERKAVMAFRTLYKKLKKEAEGVDREKVSGQEVNDVMRELFSHRCVPIKVLSHQVGDTVSWMATSAYEKGGDVYRKEDGEIAGSGFVDVVMRDAQTPHRWHMAAVTANENTNSQGDQVARHLGAIQRSIEMGLPPFSKEDSVVPQFLSPALVYTDPSRPIAKGFVQGFGDSGYVLTKEQGAAVNAMASLAMIASVDLKVAPLMSFLQARHRVFGSVSSLRGGMDREPSSLVSEAVSATCQVLDILESHGSKMNFKEGSTANIVRQTHNVVDGLLAWAADRPEINALMEKKATVQAIAESFASDDKNHSIFEKEWSLLNFQMSPDYIEKRLKILKKNNHVRYEAVVKDQASNLASMDSNAERLNAFIEKGEQLKTLSINDAQVLRGLAKRTAPRLVDAFINQTLSWFSFNNGRYIYDGAKRSEHGTSVHKVSPDLQNEWFDKTLLDPNLNVRAERLRAKEINKIAKGIIESRGYAVGGTSYRAIMTLAEKGARAELEEIALHDANPQKVIAKVKRDRQAR